MYSLDHLTDYSYKELHQFLGNVELPSFVKEAEVFDKSAANALPDDAFADKYNRAFPINSPSDIYISNAYFINKKAGLIKLWGDHYVSDVEARITKAAELFNIKDHLDNYNSNLNTKLAADYTEDVVASVDIGGMTYDLFPYKTAEDLKCQATVFSNNIKNYPFEWRTKIAAEFVKKAGDLGLTELPDIVCKYGGTYFPDLREFQTTLERRMRKLSESYQEKYKDCIEKAASVSCREEAMKVCEQAYKIEKEAGVYDKPLLYREMGDVVDRTMVLNLDKIAELMNVVKIGENCYSIEDLQKVSPEIYKEAFECNVNVKNAQELRDFLPTAPLSDTALFFELSNIKPV